MSLEYFPPKSWLNDFEEFSSLCKKMSKNPLSFVSPSSLCLLSPVLLYLLRFFSPVAINITCPLHPAILLKFKYGCIFVFFSWDCFPPFDPISISLPTHPSNMVRVTWWTKHCLRTRLMFLMSVLTFSTILYTLLLGASYHHWTPYHCWQWYRIRVWWTQNRR